MPHTTKVKPVHAFSVPRYRSKWQDHVGTSALRCRPLASYVPLCSDLSGSTSCTAPCIAGRWLHTRSISGTVITYPVSAYSGRWQSHTHSLPLSQVLFLPLLLSPIPIPTRNCQTGACLPSPKIQEQVTGPCRNIGT